MSFLGKLFSSTPKVDEETTRLIAEVKELRARSKLVGPNANVDLATAVMTEVGEDVNATLGMEIGVPVYRIISTLLLAEPFAFVPPERAPPPSASLGEVVALRKRLREAKRMLLAEEYIVDKWATTVTTILAGLYDEFPPQAFVDPDQNGNFEEFSALTPTVPLYTFVDDLPDIIHKIIGTVSAFGNPEDGLFVELQEKLDIRLAIASGIKPDERDQSRKPIVYPIDNDSVEGRELVELYLGGTPFSDLLLHEVPLPIPEAVRFEHTHILAGTGHGKSQALQFLLAADLEKALTERRSVVVMDSQGDLLQTLLHSDFFKDQRLAESLVYIDPTDIERPVGLNLFDVGLSGLDGVSAIERETIENSTIELYEYFFGGLLGAELTQRQGLIFRYLAMLMTRIPGANIHTLRELMEDGEPFRPYMEALTGSARAFFETRFFERTFVETKKQILNRLWGVLSSPSLDRMMSAEKNSVDLFKALQRGQVVFINTAKDFLGHEGSTIFSRMFVALLGQALMRRASVPRHERTPTFIYIDEAEDVVDLTLTRMLAQVRKYKGAITFAHQNLDQLDPEVRAGVMANTSVKLAGGLSAKDARALADDFRCDPSFLLEQKKESRVTHFACYAKNVTEKAVSISIPLGYVEGRPRLGERGYLALIEGSRERYGCTPGTPTFVRTRPSAPKKVSIERVSQDPPPREESPPATLPREDIVPPIPAPMVVPTPPEECPPVVAPEGASEPAAEPAHPVEVSIALPVVPQVVAPEVVHQQEGVERDALDDAPIDVLPIAPSKPGGGGVKHKSLQSLVKELGEARGFRASIEESIHDGAGRVDVLLSRGTLVVAFEISITTTKDHELANVEKCLALTGTHVVVLVPTARRLKSLHAHVSPALQDTDRKRVSFLVPEDLPGYLDGFPQPVGAIEKTVKGYTVRSKVKDSSPDEAIARRRAIAKVVARSGKV